MTSDNTIKGNAFERWVADVIKPYTDGVNVTKTHEHFDVTINNKGKLYLLECKCFSYFKGYSKEISALCLRDVQIDKLNYRQNSLFGKNKVFYIVGIQFSRYDIFPIVLSFANAQLLCSNSHTVDRKFITMSKLLRKMSLRRWISNEFNVPYDEIVYPEFRKYLINSLDGVTNE